MKILFFDKTTLKFILVGGFNTLAGSALMFLLYNVAHFSYWTSSSANYIVCSILSFFLNRGFTFCNKEHISKTAVKFILNIAVCYFISYGIARPSARFILKNASPSLCDNIALFFALVIFTGLNYFGQRYFVFAKKTMDK